MTTDPSPDMTVAFERLLEDRKRERYVMRLYVGRITERSRSDIATLKALCEQRVPGRYELEIVELYGHPGLARANPSLAASAQVNELPPEVRRLVGDRIDPDRVILVLQ